jgi:hypothetical protein
MAVLILGSLILASCGVEKKEVRLVFKYHPGQSRQYASEIKIFSELTEQGKTPVTKSLSYKSTVLEEVASIADSATARIRLTDIIRNPDTKSDPGNPADPIDSQTQKLSIEYLTGTNGKMIDIFPMDSFNRDLITYYKNYYEQALPVFPDTPVTEGFSWTQSVKLIVKGEGNTKAETTYKVKSFVREAGFDCAVIEYDGKLILPFRGIDRDGGLVTKLERIDSHGVIYFAYNEGSIIRQTETYRSEAEGIKSIAGQARSFKASSERTSSLIFIKTDQ